MPADRKTLGASILLPFLRSEVFINFKKATKDAVFEMYFSTFIQQTVRFLCAVDTGLLSVTVCF
jgi:hypothetical protein